MYCTGLYTRACKLAGANPKGDAGEQEGPRRDLLADTAALRGSLIDRLASVYAISQVTRLMKIFPDVFDGLTTHLQKVGGRTDPPRPFTCPSIPA